MFDRKRYVGIDIGDHYVACLVSKRGKVKHMTSKHPSDDLIGDVIDLIQVLLDKSKTKIEDVVHIAIGSVEEDLTIYSNLTKMVTERFDVPCHVTCPAK